MSRRGLSASPVASLLRHNESDSIVIDSPPEPIWEWVSDLATHYTQWHPDHVSAEWERGEPNRVGSVMRAVEDLGGTREVLRLEMVSIDPPRRFEYRIRGPISMLLPRGAFVIAPHNEGSRFTASISYRFGALTERAMWPRYRRRSDLELRSNSQGTPKAFPWARQDSFHTSKCLVSELSRHADHPPSVAHECLAPATRSCCRYKAMRRVGIKATRSLRTRRHSPWSTRE